MSRSDQGTETVLKAGLRLQGGEVVDSSCMNVRALNEFYAAQISDCKANNILLSLHLKVGKYIQSGCGDENSAICRPP